MESRNLFISVINIQHIKIAHSFMQQSLQIVPKTNFFLDKEQKPCTLGQLIHLWNLLS